MKEKSKHLSKYISKKNILLLLIIFMLNFVFGQNYKVQTFKLDNGIPFYYVQNSANDIDAIAICVEGNVFQLSGNYSGLETILFDMMASGSTQYNPDFIKNFEYETGSKIRGYSESQFSCLTMECTSESFKEALPVFTSCFTSPDFSNSNFSNAKNRSFQLMSGSLGNPAETLPFYAVDLLAKQLYFCATPFLTPESLRFISLQNVYSHHFSLLDARRISIIAVTKQPSESIYSDLNKMLGTIPSGTKKIKSKLNPSQPSGSMILTHQKASASGFAARLVRYPEISDRKTAALYVAELIYSDILKSVLCEQKEICSNAFAVHTTSFPDFGYEAFMNCTDFENLKKSASEARNILLKGNYISSAEENGEFLYDSIENVIEGYKNSLTTTLYSRNVTSLGIINQFLESLMIFNSPDFQNQQVSRIHSVTAKDVTEAFSEFYGAQEDFWLCIVAPEQEETVETIFN